MIDKRIQIIDVLRVIAVFAVVLYHFFPSFFPYGFMGVDIFLVISGFVISKSLREKNDNYKPLSFFKRRFLRLYPNLAVVVLLTYVSYSFIFPSNLTKLLINSSVSSLGIFSNIFYGSISGYFDLVSEINPLLHTWSLSVEWQFYLLVAFLLFFFKKIKSVDNVMVILTVASIICMFFLMDKRPIFNFYSVTNRFFEFGLGFYSYNFFSLAIYKISSRVINAFLLLILTSLYFVNFDFNASLWPNQYTLLLCLFVLCIIFNNSDLKITNIRIKELIFWLSDRSYSIYLVHYPFAAYLKYLNTTSINYTQIFIFILLIIFISNFTYVYIENKFRYSNINLLNYLSIAIIPFFIIVYFFTRENVSYDEKYGKYVSKKFLSLASRTKNLIDRDIYVVGDSYAEDFTNILTDGLGVDTNRLSCSFIDMNCGNLFIINDEKFQKKVKASNLSCNSSVTYMNVLNSIKTNDILLLASNWPDWTIDYMDQSLKNIREKFSGKIVIVGTKHIGKQSPFYIDNLPIEKRYNLVSKPPAFVSEINKKISFISSKYEDVIFIDIQHYLLTNDGYGIVCDNTGNLISYDGGHLTSYGVKFITNKISKEIRELFYEKKQD